MYTIKFKDGTTKEFKTLVGADLRGANLWNADLQGADLRGANLRGAYLGKADLQSADLQSADLQNVNLQSADLQSADLQNANLRGAYFNSCNFDFTKGILIANFGQHTTVAWSKGVNIGCMSYGYDEWLRIDFIETIGKEHDYSNEEIILYKKFIEMGKEYFNA